MKVQYYGRSQKEKFEEQFGAKKLSLPELLQSSDVISLHCPLTADTHHLISTEEIKLMPDSCLLINTARGELIDSKALELALDQGKFFGVGLDVTDPEPLQKDSPLLKHERVLVLPHIGSATMEAREAMAKLCVENLINYFSQRPCPTKVV